MRRSRRWTWACGVLAAASTLAGCGGEGRHGEDGDQEDVSVAGPTVPVPVPGTTPAAGPTPTPAPGTTPAPTARVAYVQDIKPILDADCVRCHGELSTYQGVRGVAQPGSASSRLVRVTQPGGSMYGYLSGDAAARSELIRSWVVDNGAAETR